ncbi:MAG: DUF4926 domain-containing protein [Alphaproteobacteria bacterium]|nr:DUF4926 domain-containing protein [Alphaproteobacteria bacterium]
MTSQSPNAALHPTTLDAVALLSDRTENRLTRGQVGTVVDAPGDGTVLVEFSDDEGRAYAVVRCRESELLVLHYEPETA